MGYGPEVLESNGGCPSMIVVPHYHPSETLFEPSSYNDYLRMDLRRSHTGHKTGCHKNIFKTSVDILLALPHFRGSYDGLLPFVPLA